MICPGPDEDSYKVCLECRACYPGLPAKVQKLLEISADVRDYFTLQERVMA